MLRLLLISALLVLYCPRCLHSHRQSLLDASYNHFSTWQISGSSVGTWSDLASSSSGQYGYAIAYGSGIYRSTNYGVSFAKVTTSTSNWQAVASCDAGDKVIANDFTSGLYLSTNFGVTFTSANALVSFGGDITLASSSTGQYLFASSNASTSNFYYSSNSGSSWSSATLVLSSGKVVCSSDGQTVLVGTTSGSVWRSADAGVTFVTSYQVNSIFHSVRALKCSSTVQYCAALCGAKLFLSSDTGMTWSQSTFAPATNVTGFTTLTGLSVGSTGQYMSLSVFNEHVYRSSDYGASWVQSSTFVAPWGALATDGAGANLLASTSVPGNLFYSHSNGGGGASPTTAPTLAAALQFPSYWNYSDSLPYAQYTGVAASSTGRYVALSATTANYLTSYGSYGVYTSADYGLTYTAAALTGVGSSLGAWNDVAVSSTGQFAMASEQSSGLYLSQDFGASYALLYAPANKYTFKVTTSSDFLAMFAITVDVSTGMEWWFRSDDGGSTFTSQQGSTSALAGLVSGSSVACSSTGQYVVIAQKATSKLFVSSNFGSFYSQPTSLSASLAWSDVAMSSSGSVIYAVSSASSTAVVSTNTGSTFTSLSTGISGIVSVACNYVGNIVTVATSTGSVYRSIDSGRSWKLSLSLSGVSFTAVASSMVSNHLVAASSPGFALAFLNSTLNTFAPTLKPTTAPTRSPTRTPTKTPTLTPTLKPTVVPTTEPTVKPSLAPSLAPSIVPTLTPTVVPTAMPTTATPTLFPPTTVPTPLPTTEPTAKPTRAPTNTRTPTISPTLKPTTAPLSLAPTRTPTTLRPTGNPANFVSFEPTTEPTLAPTVEPTLVPTTAPSLEAVVNSNTSNGTALSNGIIGAIAAAIIAAVLLILAFVCYRVYQRKHRAGQIYAAPVVPSAPPAYGDDDYMAPVVGGRSARDLEEARGSVDSEGVGGGAAVGVEPEEEEEVEEEGAEEEEEVNEALPLAVIENNLDGSTHEVIAVAEWTPGGHHSGGATPSVPHHRHLPSDTGDLVEVDEEEAMDEGVVFVVDAYVTVINTQAPV